MLWTWPFNRLVKCSISKITVIVNCHVFQQIQYSDLQVFSTNHVSIKIYPGNCFDYVLLIFLQYFTSNLFRLLLCCWKHHQGYHTVVTVRILLIHKTHVSFWLETKLYFGKKKSFDRWDYSGASFIR